MYDAVNSEEYKGHVIEIHVDDAAANPRTEWDNFGTMVCFHRRYDLGDKHDFTVESAKEFFTEGNKDVLWLPLYLYDHSGLTMNTTGFSCPWDSGQVGFIYVTKKKIMAEYGVKRVSKKLERKVYELLRGEVTVYDAYLSGDVYGYVVKEADGEEVLESVWGFYGYSEIDYMTKEAKGIIDALEGKK